MACDNLTHTISFSNNTPLIGETVTCTATVTNTGTITEQFHVVFAQSGMSPFSTSTVKTIAPGATVPVTATFQGTIATTVNICADVVCDTIPTGVFQYYPSDYFWNVRCDHLPVHASNPTYSAYLTSTQTGLTGVVRNGALLGCWETYTQNYVSSATPRKILTYMKYGGYDYPWKWGDYTIQYPIPTDAAWSGVAALAENSYYFLDKAANTTWATYDGRMNYRVEYPSATLISSPGDMACVWSGKFDLTSYALRPLGQSGCSMSGLLPTPGFIKKAELDAGVINHALFGAILHASKDYVYPARSSGSGSTYPIPNGTRFRIKPSFDISGFTGYPRVVMECLKKYGVFVLENTSNHELLLCSERGCGLSYTKFTAVPPTAWEAVDMSSMIIDNMSGQMKAGTF